MLLLLCTCQTAASYLRWFFEYLYRHQFVSSLYWCNWQRHHCLRSRALHIHATLCLLIHGSFHLMGVLTSIRFTLRGYQSAFRIRRSITSQSCQMTRSRWLQEYHMNAENFVQQSRIAGNCIIVPFCTRRLSRKSYSTTRFGISPNWLHEQKKHKNK